MTLIHDSPWSLQLEPSGLIPLVFEEPENFIHEICGKILRRENHSERDQIAGLFRIYYADFKLGWNHNVRAREILDTYQHTYDYADVVLGSDETPFSKRGEIFNLKWFDLDFDRQLIQVRKTKTKLNRVVPMNARVRSP